MASTEAVLVENAVSKLYYLQFISIGISTFLSKHFSTSTVSFEAIAMCFHTANWTYEKKARRS